MLAIYVRLSNEDDASNSITHQLLQSKEYIKQHQPEYANNFKEYNEGKGKSGTKDRTKRPQLDKLIKDIEAGLVTSVWMRKQDRLARSGKVALDFAAKIQENNVYLYFGDKGHVDLNDTMTYFTFGQMALFDELKPKMQSTETIKSLKRNAEKGKVSGILPYGYKSKKMIPFKVKKEAETVNWIFDLYLEGLGMQSICNELNEAKIPTKYHKIKETRKIWQSSTINAVLKNTWYNGTRTYQGVQYDVPRIVDEVKYHKVQKARELRKNKRFNDRPKANYLLRSLLKCGTCGRNYIGRYRENLNSENYYNCSSKRSGVDNCGADSINIPKLDSFILKHLFNNQDLYNHLQAIQASNSVTNQLKIDIDEIIPRITKTNNRVTNYARLLGDALEGDTDIINEYNNAKAQVKVLNDKLLEMKINLSDATNSEALTKFNNIYDKFDINADFDTIQEAVHSLIETITIAPNVDETDGKIYFIIQIDFIGFTERSIFMSKKPLKEWIHLASTTTEPVDEEIQRDIEILYYHYDNLSEEKKLEKFPEGRPTFTQADVLQDFYHLESYGKIILDKSELVDFNRKKKTT